MAKVVLRSNVARSPILLWDAIKQFGALADWNPLVRRVRTEGNAVGCTREIEFEGTGKFIERLEQLDDGNRVYTYSVIDSPLPIANCSVQVRVKDNGDGTSTVEWTGNFDADPGDELTAVKTFQCLYQDALDGLDDVLGGGVKGTGW